jgi:5-formyltetrahydrofolate cyclo-ligase
LEELHMPSAAVAPPSSPPINEIKRRLRPELIADRQRRTDPAAGQALRERIAALGPFRPGAPVSGFHSSGGEIDVLPALAWFAAEGHPTALPVVTGRGRPLAFRAWRPGEPLIKGVLDIPMPAADAAEIVPEILLVPLLAFDRRGHRLGYGGGYYDRTLAALRAAGSAFAIGVGFAFQEMAEVPAAAGDQPLDAIATERWSERLA